MNKPTNIALLRQLKDIQYQAAKLVKGNPSIVDIDNFRKYSNELVHYLQEHIDLVEIIPLIDDIPSLKEVEKELQSKMGFAFGLRSWSRQRRIIAQAQQDIQIAQGKYASIEFILKNYTDLKKSFHI